MKWLWLCLGFGFALPVFAQAPKPALEVRVHSVNDLFATAQFVADIFGQTESTKQGIEFLKSQTDAEKGLYGIDPTRPWGLYATMTPDVIDSPVILMIPITDGEAFLDTVRGKLSLDPKKDQDGNYKLEVPNFPVPVFFKLTKTQALVTIQSAKSLEAKNIIPEKEFFAQKEEAQVSAKLHFSRIPESVKKVVFGQWELQANDGMKRALPMENPVVTKLRQWALKQSLPGLYNIIFQGEAFKLGVFTNTKTHSGEMAIQAGFTAKPGSDLAKQLAVMGTRSGLTLPKVSGLEVARISMKLAMMPEMQASFGKLITEIYDDQLPKLADNEKAGITLFYNALKPTVEAGELDMDWRAVGGAKPEQIIGLGGIRLVEGQQVASLVKLGASVVPKDQAKFNFDRKKIEKLRLHTAEIMTGKFEEYTGLDKLHLATGESRLLLAIHPKEEMIETLALSKEAPQKPLVIAVRPASLSRYFDVKNTGDKYVQNYKKAFGVSPGDPNADDLVELQVTGGEEMQVQFRIRAKTATFIKLSE
ncbi:MAG: hypothetical protein ACRC8S_04980 [Fimbriiglobus sp.]